MPDSGEMDYVLVFEALPEETQVIHLLSPSDTEGNTYDISLVPSSGKTFRRWRQSRETGSRQTT